MNAEVAVIKTAAETALAQTFAQARDRLPGDDAIVARRDAAFDVFAKHGLPHRRIEEWKYTDLRALMREAKPLAAPPDASSKARAKDAGRLLGDLDARRLVFVDGAFVAEQSDLRDLESGLAVSSLAQALTDGDPVVTARLGKLAPSSDAAVALNTALMGDGAVIRVASGATIERPLHLLFVASEKPAATFARSLVTIDHGARVMLIESHEGPAASDYQVNAAHSIMGRVLFTSEFQPAPYSLAPDNLLTTFDRGRDNLASSYAIGDTWLVSPQTVLSTRLAVNYTNIHRLGADFFNWGDLGVKNYYSFLPKYLILNVQNSGFLLGGGTASNATYRTFAPSLNSDASLTRPVTQQLSRIGAELAQQPVLRRASSILRSPAR